MRQKHANGGQIWFYEDSPAASLVAPLRGQYRLEPLPGPKQGQASSARDKGSGEMPSPAADDAPVVCLIDLGRDDFSVVGQLAEKPNVRLIGVVESERSAAQAEDEAEDASVFAYLPSKASRALLEKTIAAAFANIELAARERAAREELERTQDEMEELHHIGVALSAQHEVEALLDMILQKAREITGADAGSLYLVEETAEGKRLLRFQLTQNDSRKFPFKEFTVPLTEDSMAGYAALHGEALNLPDAYRIPLDKPYRFNPAYDKESGYRTRSLLTLPMRNAKGEVLGVLQLINCKRDRAARLDSDEAVAREVQSFSEHSIRLGLSLASQAAVACENSTLYRAIESLLEGFVKAAVTAIEQRDPTTSGHSLRVTTLTEGLAETVDSTTTGSYAAVRFDRKQMKEIRYAALLHDFGKVGVREEILVKAKKLYPLQLELVRQRFDYIRKELEASITRQKFEALLKGSREDALAKIDLLDQEHERALADIDAYLQFILHVNEPTVLPEGKFDRLLDIARRSFRDASGMERPFLSAEEVRFLSIPKGSLDPDERYQIESHVIHTFNFLAQIPWTKELKEVPQIARAHHEKLDGSGYPYKLKGHDIPLPAKIMTICDIFDALSASDRPYKKAVPVERALAILDESVQQNELDEELFRLFLEAKIYQRTVKRH